jgi:hypothetical protein
MKNMWILILIVLMLPIAMAQAPAPPSDIDNVVLQKMAQEHQNTRLFLSNELTRQREQFKSDFDARAAFYEKEFFDTLNTAVLKLALIWGAVIFCTVGLSNMLRITLENKRFKRMKAALKEELRAELLQKSPAKPVSQQQQTAIFEQQRDNVAAYAYQPSQAAQEKKEGWFARRKKRRLEKQQEALQRKPAMQQPIIPAQSPEMEQIKRMTEEYQKVLTEKFIEAQAAKAAEPASKVEVYH